MEALKEADTDDRVGERPGKIRITEARGEAFEEGGDSAGFLRKQTQMKFSI